MKRIWKRALCAAVLCTILLSGCAPLGSLSESGSAAADPLTGQELLYPGERAAAVVIENSAGSIPQWGIGSASIVLEALTEINTLPSLCLVYPSVSAMPTVGPVTMGQDLYWRLLSGQQVLPIQRGCGQYTRNYLDYYNLRAVDAFEVGRNAFTAGNEWITNPLWRTSGSAVAGVLPDLNISSAINRAEAAASSAASSANSSSIKDVSVAAFLPQQTDPHLPEADAEDAAQVCIDFQSLSTTYFSYDESNGVYGMQRSDGTPRNDANTGTQAEFDNLLILYSSSTLRDDEETLDYDLTMGGGVWLNGGKLWHITWTQGTSSTFKFYDSDGRPLHIRSGRSYLALISSLTGQELTVRNSAGEIL